MTPMGRRGRARGWPSSPACWICLAGRRGCGASPARNGRIPGAQLRFTDVDGHRFTCFTTSIRKGQLACAPKRLRLRLFSAAERIVRGGRHLRLRIAATWPWASHLTAAVTRLPDLAPG